MWPLLIVLVDPQIEIGLQLVDRTIHFFAERDTIELIEHGFVEALTDAVDLRALGLGARVINVLDRKIEFVFVSFGGCRNTRCRDRSARAAVVLLEQWQHPVVE